ncbi:hypothetical protein HDU89_000961 [Geranomyces variabilis]|nr:hypothetical protein HDU89_000961 [Geranomyces variabilis]
MDSQDFETVIAKHPEKSWIDFVHGWRQERDALESKPFMSKQELKRWSRLHNFLSILIAKRTYAPKGKDIFDRLRATEATEAEKTTELLKKALGVHEVQSKTNGLQSETTREFVNHIIKSKPRAGQAEDVAIEPGSVDANGKQPDPRCQAEDVAIEPGSDSPPGAPPASETPPPDEDATAAKSVLKALSTEYVFERYRSPNAEELADDFWFDGHNISSWVRRAQHHLAAQCHVEKKTLAWRLEDIADILLLNDVLVVSETYLPFMAKRSATARKTLIKLGEHHASRFLGQASETVDASKVSQMVSELCCGKSRLDVLERFLADMKKSVSLTKANAVIAAFVEAIDKAKVERRLGITPDEDTIAHDLLHVIITQAFNDEHTVTTWANGESGCSREQRQHYIPSATGKKADCRVIAEIGELLFVELKRDKHTETSSAVIFDLYKLGRFMQASLNQQIRKHPASRPVVFALHPIRDTINVYTMYIENTGLYVMAHIARPRVPTTLEQLPLLSHLIPTVFALKAAMNVRIEENVEPDDFLLEMNAKTPEYDLGLGKRARSPTPTPATKKNKPMPDTYLGAPLSRERRSLSRQK